jgi:hypothetical protein
MTRLRDSHWRYQPTLPLTISLVTGPTEDDELTEEQLEIGWAMEGEKLMESCRANANPCWRPYGHWRFGLGEEPPEGEAEQARRLAELGELSDDELSELEHRAMTSQRWWAVFESVRAPASSPGR